MGTHVFDPGVKNIWETMSSHEVKRYNPETVLHIILGVLFSRAPDLPEVDEGIQLDLGLFDEMKKMSVGNLFPAQQFLYQDRILFNVDANGCPKVLGDIFGVVFHIDM